MACLAAAAADSPPACSRGGEERGKTTPGLTAQGRAAAVQARLGKETIIDELCKKRRFGLLEAAFDLLYPACAMGIGVRLLNRAQGSPAAYTAGAMALVLSGGGCLSNPEAGGCRRAE